LIPPLWQVRQDRGVDAVETRDERHTERLRDGHHRATVRPEVCVHQRRVEPVNDRLDTALPRRTAGGTSDRLIEPPRRGPPRSRPRVLVDPREWKFIRVRARVADHRRLEPPVRGHHCVDKRLAPRQKLIDRMKHAGHVQDPICRTATGRFVRYDSTPARQASTVRPASSIEHSGRRRSRIAATKSVIASTQASECSYRRTGYPAAPYSAYGRRASTRRASTVRANR